ncbi:Hypothetical_protein [Hexamita inflata]|uniref:Hypothetical_protein n=1 Tax=Hexamita inflata TaxID=28002 RepID=A0AA86RI91_9EUKA|nr:Hypothetical protein HINF_LOCUS62923 [Hexamita inflata]
MPPYKNKFQILAGQDNEDNGQYIVQKYNVAISQSEDFQKQLNIPNWAIQQVLIEQSKFQEALKLQINQDIEDIFSFMRNEQGNLIITSSSEQIVNFVAQLAWDHYKKIITWSGLQTLILQNKITISQLWKDQSRFCYSVIGSNIQCNPVYLVVDSSTKHTHIIKSVISANETLNQTSWQQILSAQFDEMAKYYSINLNDYNYFMNAWFGSINIMSQTKIYNNDQLIKAVNENSAYISFKMCEDETLTDFMLKNSQKKYGWRNAPLSKGEPLHEVVVHKFDDKTEIWGRSFGLTFFIPSAAEGLFDTKVLIRLTPKILDDQTELLTNFQQNEQGWKYISVRKQPIDEHIYAHKMNFENEDNKETFVFWSTKQFSVIPELDEQCVGDQINQFMESLNTQNVQYYYQGRTM